MDIKLLMRKILFWISVPKCVFCGEKLDFSDRGLCPSCRRIYEEHKSRNCSRCSRELRFCTCSNEHLRAHSIKRHVKIFRYLHNQSSAPGNQLIFSLKEDNREDVIDFLADELSTAIFDNIDADFQDCILTNVPRRKISILNFGFDHTKQLAIAISRKTGIKYTDLFVSRSKRAQKGLSGQDRIRNADYDYKRWKHVDLRGQTAIIVDDVTTTGSTLGACATLAKGLGVREVIALTVASAYNDEYVKREIKKRDRY